MYNTITSDLFYDREDWEYVLRCWSDVYEEEMAERSLQLQLCTSLPSSTPLNLDSDIPF